MSDRIKETLIVQTDLCYLNHSIYDIAKIKTKKKENDFVLVIANWKRNISSFLFQLIYVPCSLISVSQYLDSSLKYLSKMNTFDKPMPNVAMALYNPIENENRLLLFSFGYFVCVCRCSMIGRDLSCVSRN